MNFDTYFNVLELIIEPKTDSILIIEFFICFNPILRDKIKISGRDMLSMNRQEMVTFVQCVWHGMVQAGEVKQNNRDQDNNHSSTSRSKGTYRDRGRGGFQDCGYGN